MTCFHFLRENETQTDPWTPEHVIRPGSAPEVLTLANLAYGMDATGFQLGTL